MSEIYTAEGIILKRRNIGEADRIITLYTRKYGKIRAIAKGIRKISSKRSPHLEIFNRVTVTLHRGKTFDSICEVVSLKEQRYPTLTSIGYRYYLLELLDVLTPDRQPHDEVYEVTKQVLSTISRDGETMELIEFYANTLLHLLGFLEISRNLDFSEMTPFVETIIEKHLKTPKILNRLNR